MTGRLAERHVAVGDLRLFVRSGGPGGPRCPIVCVHGAVISGRYMVPTASRLATAWPVVVPDLPGYGRSDDPPRPLRVPELSDVLRALLDALGIERAHVLGNSLGAQIAADFAARHPARTASALLVGPTVDAAARTRLRTLWRLAKDAFLERPTLIPLHLIDILRAGPRFAKASLDIAIEDRIEDKLPSVAAPVLIVSGRRDPLVPRAWSTWLASITPHAHLEFLAGPHALNFSRPDALTATVERFLAAASD